MTSALRLERTFAGRPDDVFDAWTDPVLLRRWFVARPHWRSPSAEVDLRVGGAYRLAMEDTDTGEVRSVVGTYLEVERPHEGFDGDPVRDLHEHGWSGCLDTLASRGLGTKGER
jgi:uncharacterized protein YndB with AHSA1/START domain